MTHSTTFTFEFYRISISLKLHLFILINNILKINPLLIQFLYPLLRKMRTILKNQFIIKNQQRHSIFLFLTHLTNFMNSRCTIRLVYLYTTTIAFNTNCTAASFALMLLIHYQLKFFTTNITISFALSS